MAEVIDHFEGEYFFLSNFSPHPVWFGHRGYKTAEHAFQAQKTYSINDRDWIASQPTPGKAKRAGSKKGLSGRKIQLRSDWEDIKLDVMRVIVKKKFSQHPELANPLIATGDAELIEGNNWGDKYWGQVDGEGENWLGKILMIVRFDLQMWYNSR